jgi:predicted RNase H-like nuclease
LRALGVDLAWADATTANETGVVAAESDGTIVAAGWTTGVEETVAWANTHATDATVLFVDAPLVVLNADKQRLCEKQVGQRYGRWKVSANSTNLASPRLAGVRFKCELEACGWAYADGIAGPPRGGCVVSECYPYTTIVGTDELGYESERPRYKRKPKGLWAAAWRPVRAAACDVLIQRIADLRNASAPLDLRSHPVTAQLLVERSPLDDRAYKHREDLIDACLAAWTAALWIRFGADRYQVLGEHDILVDDRGQRATIIAPARPSQRPKSVKGNWLGSSDRRRCIDHRALPHKPGPNRIAGTPQESGYGEWGSSDGLKLMANRRRGWRDKVLAFPSND